MVRWSRNTPATAENGRHYALRRSLGQWTGPCSTFHAGERLALTETLAAFQLPCDDALRALYSRVNQSHWKSWSAAKPTQPRLRVERFARFSSGAARRTFPTYSPEPERMSVFFVEALSRQRIPMRGAEDFLQRVSAHMPVYLSTVSPPCSAAVLSERATPVLCGSAHQRGAGHFKPDPYMLTEAMRRAGVTDPDRAVMLGDSVTADIGAAIAAGAGRSCSPTGSLRLRTAPRPTWRARLAMRRRSCSPPNRKLAFSAKIRYNMVQAECFLRNRKGGFPMYQEVITAAKEKMQKTNGVFL